MYIAMLTFNYSSERLTSCHKAMLTFNYWSDRLTSCHNPSPLFQYKQCQLSSSPIKMTVSKCSPLDDVTKHLLPFFHLLLQAFAITRQPQSARLAFAAPCDLSAHPQRSIDLSEKAMRAPLSVSIARFSQCLYLCIEPRHH